MTGRAMRQRIAITAMLFAAAFGGLVLRAVHLTILQGDWLRQRATRQHQRAVPVAARPYQ